MNSANILLVAATALEIPKFLEETDRTNVHAGMLIGSVPGQAGLHVLITGPGMHSTNFFLTRVLEKNKYDVVINAGIAGSFRDEYPIGSAVQIVRDGLPELGATDKGKFIPFYEMDMARPFRPEFIDADGWITNQTCPELLALKNIPQVTGISVSTISNDAGRISDILERTRADVESMEGAAFFWCCHYYNLPCMQIRTISNRITPGHLTHWDIPLAVANLHTLLIEILNELR